jgi:hypothetical protein
MAKLCLWRRKWTFLCLKVGEQVIAKSGALAQMQVVLTVELIMQNSVIEVEQRDLEAAGSKS